MSDKLTKIRGLVGSWAEFLAPEFANLKSVEENLKKRKIAGEQVHGDPFEHFRKVDISHVKVVFIVYDLRHMGEKEWFCHEQGIMYFPRHLTWSDDVVHHHEWSSFSETVLLMILRYKVLVVCDLAPITSLINKMSPNTIVIKPENSWDIILEYTADDKIVIPF